MACIINFHSILLLLYKRLLLRIIIYLTVWKISLSIVKRSFSLSSWHDLGVCAEALDDSKDRLDLLKTDFDEVCASCCLIVTGLLYSSTRSKTLSLTSTIQLMLERGIEHKEPCSLRLLCCWIWEIMIFVSSLFLLRWKNVMTDIYWLFNASFKKEESGRYAARVKDEKALRRRGESIKVFQASWEQWATKWRTNISYKILSSLRLSLLRKMLRKITNIFDSNLICALFQLFFSTSQNFLSISWIS